VTDISISLPPPRKQRRPDIEKRPDIELPDGEILTPRARFAESVGLADRTAQRLNLPTIYVGNIAYVARNASLKQIGARVKRRNEPVKRRRS
jgi:hypothetical protein